MEQYPPILETPPLAQPPVFLGARLFNVFATPGEVFETIKDTAVSTANWIIPGVLLIVVSWLGAWLIFSQPQIQQQLREITDQAIDKQVQKGKISEQQAEQSRAVAAKFAGIGSKIGAYGAPILAAFVVPFWSGLLLWLIGNHALNGNISYMKGVELAGVAGMIAVLEAVVKTLLIVVTGNLFAS